MSFQGKESIKGVSVDCGCASHYEKVELDTVFPLPAKFVFEGLFGANAYSDKRSLWNALTRRRKLTDIEAPEPLSFSNEEGAIRSFRVKYRVPVSNPMIKEKETPCIETIQITKAEEYLCYVVDVSAKTPNVPYGDSFEMRIRYCIVAEESPGQCRIKLTVMPHFFKSLMLKGVIKNASIKGFSEFTQLLTKILTEASKPIDAAEIGALDEVAPKFDMDRTQGSTSKAQPVEPSGFLELVFSKLGYDLESPVIGLVIQFIWFFFLLTSFSCIFFTWYQTMWKSTEYHQFLQYYTELQSHASSTNLSSYIPKSSSYPLPGRKTEWNSIALQDHQDHYAKLVNYALNLAKDLEDLLLILNILKDDLVAGQNLNQLSDDWLSCSTALPGSALSCEVLQERLAHLTGRTNINDSE